MQQSRIVLRRDENYWGADLPTRRGMFNFDEVDLEYFRDDQTMFEALKAGLIDFFWETNAARSTRGCDFEALREGRIVKETARSAQLEAMKDFTFNLRNELFQDPRLREAIGMMVDFEGINANFYSGLYVRTRSFFDESEFSCAGIAASAAERALLARFPGAVKEDILEGRWRPPPQDGTG
jgi:peptide/nickel transport system substrate-binding protein